MASTGGIQSSRLSGKYSYSMSAVSSGLPFGWFCPARPPAETDAIDLANWGLCVLSGPDRFGLRSSSDKERFIGSVGPPAAPCDVCLDINWDCGEERPANLLLPLELVVSEPHVGTGGRVKPGETATFLLG